MRYALAIGGIILVAIIAIILIVSRGPSDNPSRPASVTLSDYANQNSIVSHTTQGEVVGEDQRRAIRISVTPTERRFEVLAGYEEAVERSQTYPNTQAAYEAFLKALHYAGFTRSRASSYDGPIGVCPLGTTFIYDVSADGQSRLNLWSDSCRRDEGTFAGNASLVRQLFQQQISDYNQQISGVNLHGANN
jgi:hypothetical protein